MLLDGTEMACTHNSCCDLLSTRKQVIELEKAACSCPARVNPEHPVIEQSKRMPDGKLSWGDHAVLQLIALLTEAIAILQDILSAPVVTDQLRKRARQVCAQVDNINKGN